MAGSSPRRGARWTRWRPRSPSGAPGPLIADPRRPIPGTKLVREWQGEEQVVTVLTEGFEWQGRRFKSLSAAVRAITGSHWNGWKFFGLAHGAEARP